MVYLKNGGEKHPRNYPLRINKKIKHDQRKEHRYQHADSKGFSMLGKRADFFGPIQFFFHKPWKIALDQSQCSEKIGTDKK